MSIFKKIILLIIIALAFFVRLYKINSPIADWHSHRQADTASVTNQYLNGNANIFIPKYHDLSNVQSGKENPKGYRMVELPIYNYLSLINYKVINIFNKNIPKETTYRLTSIFISILSAIFIFLLVFQFTKNYLASILSMSSFLFLPFNIYYSRAILPEPLAILFTVLTLYSFNKNKILSGIFFALGILTKPYIGIIIFPYLLYASLQKINLKKIIYLVIFSLISLLPFIIWRLWIKQFSEGIPSSNWLMNSSDSTTFPEWWHGINLSWLNKMVAFRPYWFNWLFVQRISILILGSYGLIFAFLGLNYKKNQIQKFTVLSLIGILFYFIIFARGNIQHDYYQNLIMPFISIYFGLGIFYIYEIIYSKKLTSLFTIIPILFLSIFFSWQHVKEYYKVNNSTIVEVGKIIDQKLPKDAIVIAPYQGDTAFLYQTNRSGYPTEIYNIKETISLTPNNPHFLVSTNYDTYTNQMISKYQTVDKTDQYIILNLDNEQN